MTFMLITRIAALSIAILTTGCATSGHVDIRKAVENGLMPRTVVQGEPARTFNVYDRMKRYRVPAMSVAVIRGGDVIWTAVYELPSTTPPAMSEDTVFQAASISKSVTGLLATRLAQAGKIDLDTDIDIYLAPMRLPPGKQTPDNPVTLRKLLTHTAGATVPGFPGYPPGTAIPTDEQVVSGHAPASTAPVTIATVPGTNYAYSGGGYTVAQVALERRMGQTYEQLMRQWVIDPLQMRHSTFEQPLPASVTKRATGHFYDGTEIPGGANIYPEKAAAGLWTTPRDLALFVTAMRRAYLQGDSFLTTEWAHNMLMPALNKYAFGVFVAGEGAHRRVMHSGGNAGFKSTYAMYLDSGDGIVVMTNGDNGSYLGGEYVKAVAAAYDWPDFRPRVAEMVPVDRDAAVAHLGTYRFDNTPERTPDIVVLTKKNDDWSLMLPDIGVVRLIPTGPRSFVSLETGETIEMSAKGTPLTLSIGGRRATFDGGKQMP